jgi:hypothetical protein
VLSAGAGGQGLFRTPRSWRNNMQLSLKRMRAAELLRFGRRRAGPILRTGCPLPCRAQRGCQVEPDGHCPHGAPSLLLALGLICQRENHGTKAFPWPGCYPPLVHSTPYAVPIRTPGSSSAATSPALGASSTNTTAARMSYRSRKAPTSVGLSAFGRHENLD